MKSALDPGLFVFPQGKEFEMHIIVRGNPVDGLWFCGPFESHEDAVAAGDIVDTEWWVAPLEGPDE